MEALAELPGKDLGIAAAKVERIQVFRKRFVMERGEGNKRPAGLFQDAFIFLVVEAECLILGYAKPFPWTCSLCGDRR